MSKRIRYTDEPLGRLEVVADFLPPPEQLAFREEGVKITTPRARVRRTSGLASTTPPRRER